MSRAQSCKRCHACNTSSGPDDPCKCVVKTSAPSEAMLAREVVAQWARVNGDPFASTLDEKDEGPMVKVDRLLAHIGACQVYLKTASWSGVSYRVRNSMEASQDALRMLMDSDRPVKKPAMCVGVDIGFADYSVATFINAPSISKALVDAADKAEKLRFMREYIGRWQEPPAPFFDRTAFENKTIRRIPVAGLRSQAMPGMTVPGVEPESTGVESPKPTIRVVEDEAMPHGWMALSLDRAGTW